MKVVTTCRYELTRSAAGMIFMPVGIVAESEWTANSGREGMDSEQWQRGNGQRTVAEREWTADSGGDSRQWWGQQTVVGTDMVSHE